MLGYEASQPPSNRARIQERTAWEKPTARRKPKLVPLVEYEGTPLGENTPQCGTLNARLQRLVPLTPEKKDPVPIL